MDHKPGLVDDQVIHHLIAADEERSSDKSIDLGRPKRASGNASCSKPVIGQPPLQNLDSLSSAVHHLGQPGSAATNPRRS
jgi:hypothetical protein